VPLDSNGCYTEQITDFKGLQISEANKHVAKALRDRGRLLQEGIIKHSYPFCWRSDTPLIYKAIHCWFIRVTDIKEQLLANNAKSRWVPREI
jgi:isoleucyl-tRNA synthetase